MTDSRPRKTSGSPQDCVISNESIEIRSHVSFLGLYTLYVYASFSPHNILHCLCSCVAASIPPLSKITGYSILLMGKITKKTTMCVVQMQLRGLT